MIRAFKAEDMIWLIEHGVLEFGLKMYGDEHLAQLAQVREDNGQCITGVLNGEIVGSGGIDLLWPGNGEVWTMLSGNIKKCPMEAYEVIRDGLAKLVKDNKLWRVQAWGRVGFDKAHILFKHLGFKYEGTAYCYGPDGADYILYSIVNKKLAKELSCQPQLYPSS